MGAVVMLRWCCGHSRRYCAMYGVADAVVGPCGCRCHRFCTVYGITVVVALVAPYVVSPLPLPPLHHVWHQGQGCCAACGVMVTVTVVVPHVVLWSQLLHHVWVAVAIFAPCVVSCLQSFIPCVGCSYGLCAMCGVTATVVAPRADHHCCHCEVTIVVIVPHVVSWLQLLHRIWVTLAMFALHVSCAGHVCATCGVVAAVIAPRVGQGCRVCTTCGVIAVVVCATYESLSLSLRHVWCRCHYHCTT